MKSKKPKKTQKNFYYSFLTIFLLCCVIFLTITVVFNIAKLISYQSKLKEVKVTHTEAVKTQKLLKAEIDSFQSAEAYEAFLRNHLKYAAPYEILVIIVPAKKK